MQKYLKLSLVCATLLGTAAVAQTAQEAQAATKAATDAALKTTDVESSYSSNSIVTHASRELKQSINLGFANTTGNSETTTFNGKYTADFATDGYNNQELRVAFDFSAFYNKVEDADTTDEYTANLGLEQNIANGWFGYAMANWYRNEDLGYKNKTMLGAGIGKILFATEVHSLKVKLGAAYNMADFSGLSVAEAATADDSYGVLTQYVEYHRVLNEVSNFYAKIGASESFEEMSDVEGTAVLGLNFSVADRISVSVEEEIKYNGLDVFSDVLDNKADTKTVIRVGYNF